MHAKKDRLWSAHRREIGAKVRGYLSKAAMNKHDAYAVHLDDKSNILSEGAQHGRCAAKLRLCESVRHRVVRRENREIKLCLIRPRQVNLQTHCTVRNLNDHQPLSISLDAS